jgi:hypothetical protein
MPESEYFKKNRQTLKWHSSMPESEYLKKNRQTLKWHSSMPESEYFKKQTNLEMAFFNARE